MVGRQDDGQHDLETMRWPGDLVAFVRVKRRAGTPPTSRFVGQIALRGGWTCRLVLVMFTGVDRRDVVVDVAAGVALAGFLVGVTPVSRVAQPDARTLDAVGYVLLVVAGAAVGFRRRQPLIAFVLAVGAATAYLALAFPGWPIYIAALVGLLVLVAGTDWETWVPAAGAGGVAVAVGAGRPEGWQPARMVGVALVWVAVGVLAGEASTRRARRVEAEARRLVIEERLRIARELHDVLSHSLATISLHAGVGLHLLESRPEQARDALTSIRTVSTDALAQARAALSVVRDPEEPQSSEPGVGLAHLGTLVSSLRAAGLAVDFEADLAVQAPPPVEAAAYRIIQEALTNVMRHAGADARAWVSVHAVGGWLEIEIRDDGRGLAALPGGGHGLGGMRERASALGGELDAFECPAGGFQVRARLPLGADR